MYCIAICPGGCIRNADCVRPSLCRCRDGFTGPKCRWTPTAAAAAPGHKRPDGVEEGSSKNNEVGRGRGDGSKSARRCRCFNGGRCVQSSDRCKCLPGFTGHRCKIGLYTALSFLQPPCSSSHHLYTIHLRTLLYADSVISAHKLTLYFVYFTI